MKLGRRLTVLNVGGIYARPAARIVRTANTFPATTELRFDKEGYTVSVRSMLAILTLEAEQGVELLLTIEGPQAREALEAITALFNEGFGADEPRLPVPAAHAETMVLEAG